MFQGLRDQRIEPEGRVTPQTGRQPQQSQQDGEGLTFDSKDGIIIFIERIVLLRVQICSFLAHLFIFLPSGSCRLRIRKP
jgi:hypothetical protein